MSKDKIKRLIAAQMTPDGMVGLGIEGVQVFKATRPFPACRRSMTRAS